MIPSSFMSAESDACVCANKNSEEDLAAHEQAHIYETISDPTIGDSHHDVELQDVATVTYPQSLMTAELDKSTQKQEQPHLQQDTNITSNTNSSSTIHKQHDNIPSRSSVDTTRCLRYQYEEIISQYKKIPNSDVNQTLLETALEDLEQNTCFRDTQIGHYNNQSCHYERINHYEKVPHCDLSLIPSLQRKPIHDECHLYKEREESSCSDVNQIILLQRASEDLEQNVCSCGLKVGKRGHYDQISQYERISHYEKVPHCDLALISSPQRKPVRDECHLYKENSQHEESSCSDVNQIILLQRVSEDLEQNACSLKVGRRGHYDQISQYERISHYEKVPHCYLALMSSAQRKPVRDEKLHSRKCGVIVTTLV